MNEKEKEDLLMHSSCDFSSNSIDFKLTHPLNEKEYF